MDRRYIIQQGGIQLNRLSDTKERYVSGMYLGGFGSETDRWGPRAFVTHAGGQMNFGTKGEEAVAANRIEALTNNIRRRLPILVFMNKSHVSNILPSDRPIGAIGHYIATHKWCENVGGRVTVKFRFEVRVSRWLSCHRLFLTADCLIPCALQIAPNQTKEIWHFSVNGDIGQQPPKPVSTYACCHCQMTSPQPYAVPICLNTQCAYYWQVCPVLASGVRLLEFTKANRSEIRVNAMRLSL